MAPCCRIRRADGRRWRSWLDGDLGDWQVEPHDVTALAQTADVAKAGGAEPWPKSPVPVAGRLRVHGIGLQGSGALRARPVDGCVQQARSQPAAAEPPWNEEAGQGPDRRIVRIGRARDAGGPEPWKRWTRCDGAPPDGGCRRRRQAAPPVRLVEFAGPCRPSAWRGRAAQPLRAWPDRAGTSSSAVRRATRRGTRSQARWTAQRVET